MAVDAATRVVRQLRRAAFLSNGMGRTDAELLELYVLRRDDAAFETLVRRHGPMVLGVCRRVLRNDADAEDAFQATFLVLVRKASSIRSRGTVGNWLYGVAYHTALRAKAMNQRRRIKELEAGVLPKHEASEEVWRAVQAQLDKEMNSLPEKYRIAIVLCDLEGKTIKDAAEQVGWPQGTMATRLARGRAALAQRLRDQGLVLSAGVLAAVLSGGVASASVPAGLVAKVIEAAGPWALGSAAVVSAKVIALSEGVVQAIFISKLKSFLVAGLIALAVIGFGSGFVANGTSAQDTGGVSGVVPLQLPTAPAQAKLDDDPVKLKKEIERLRAELARTKLELQIARQEAALAKAQADLERLKRENEKVLNEKVLPSLPLQKKGFGGGGGYGPAPKKGTGGGADDTKPKLELPQDPKNVPTAVSPDARQVAVGHPDGALTLIDVATGKLLFKSLGHTDAITALAYSPDGKWLASGGKDSMVILWDGHVGKELRRLKMSAPASAVRFSVDGRMIIVAESDGTHVEINVESGAIISRKK